MNDRVDLSTGATHQDTSIICDLGLSSGALDPRRLVVTESDRINDHIATGRTVHFQTSAIRPWRRITIATPIGARIRFDFADGGHQVCRSWSAAVDAHEGYALGWNLKLEDAT